MVYQYTFKNNINIPKITDVRRIEHMLLLWINESGDLDIYCVISKLKYTKQRKNTAYSI